MSAAFVVSRSFDLGWVKKESEKDWSCKVSCEKMKDEVTMANRRNISSMSRKMRTGFKGGFRTVG